MPQFRQDPLTGNWTSIAPERLDRPMELHSTDDGKRNCPFCEGNEARTPGETFALRDGTSANQPGWRVRIVPNRFPFIGGEGEFSTPSEFAPPWVAQPAAGVHEVIIESPRHLTSVTELGETEMIDVVTAYRDRLRQLHQSAHWAYALIFKNSGERAGASLSHVHSQLVALPFIPEMVQAKLRRAVTTGREQGMTSWELLLDAELASGERIVAQTDRFVALCPFASRQPFEMLVLPRNRAAQFADLADEAIPELSALLQSLVARLEQVVHPLSFNWMLHTSPFDSNSQDHYHWHVEIVPRVTNWGGYEWATGYAVNAVVPEEAARQLRTPH